MLRRFFSQIPMGWMIFKNAITVCIIIFLMVFLWYRIDFLHDRVYQMDDPAEESHGKGAVAVEDHMLFDTLIKEGVMVPDPDGIRLKLPGSDQDLVYRAFLQNNPDISDKDRAVVQKKIQLLKALFHTPAGYEVKTQVRLWNQAHLLAAVRDNRQQPPGIRHNFWQATDQTHSNPFFTTGRYVPESYGFIHQGRLKPGFSNWLTASVASREPLGFQTVFQLEKAAQINIQGIGELVSATPGAKISFFNSEGKVSVAEASTAFDLTYGFPPGRHEVKLKVKSLLDTQPRIPGLKVYQVGAENSFLWKDFKKGYHFHITFGQNSFFLNRIYRLHNLLERKRYYSEDFEMDIQIHIRRKKGKDAFTKKAKFLSKYQSLINYFT